LKLFAKLIPFFNGHLAILNLWENSISYYFIETYGNGLLGDFEKSGHFWSRIYLLVVSELSCEIKQKSPIQKTDTKSKEQSHSVQYHPDRADILMGLATVKEYSMNRRLRAFGAISMVLGMISLVGCQTWIAGMTLPSPYYLQHNPQYFPEDPDFPLERELQTQIDYSGVFKQPDAGVLPPAVPAIPPDAGLPK
jgi:hypothetical protein